MATYLNLLAGNFISEFKEPPRQRVCLFTCKIPLYAKYFSKHQGPLERWLKHRWLSITPRDSDFVGLGWDLRICRSNHFPGDNCCCWTGPHFEGSWCWGNDYSRTSRLMEEGDSLTLNKLSGITDYKAD